jgi:arginyl-tRNA synthetase
MILEALKQQLIDLLIQTSGSDNLSVKHIETPPQEEWGDFSFPCFVLAKETKKDPKKMAETIVSAVFARKPHFLEQVTASGSYVNFTFAAGFIGEKLFEAFAEHKDKFGESQTCANKKVMIEFSQPNTHKEFHIGHLRNVLLGDALTRLYRASGCWVLAANYIGDFGMHVATCLWALKKFHTNEPPPKEGRAKWLGKIYAEGANAVKDNELFKQEVKDVLLAMQTRDAIWFPLFLETKEWSMKGFRAIYDELGVVFDDWFYESDLYDDGKRRVDGLLQTGVAKKKRRRGNC